MLNAEMYKDEILSIIENKHNVAIVKGNPTECDGEKPCENCDLYRYSSSCEHGLTKWMCAEADKLKPCPFCGSVLAPSDMTTRESYDDNYGCVDEYCVVCDYNNGGCGASTGGGYKTREEAIKAWNRRA